MFGGDDGARALRRAGSFPRAPPPPATARHILSRSESIKKKSGAAKRSKRARVRAGLAAALQELRLAGRKHGARSRGAGALSEAVSAGAGAGAAAGPRASDDVQGGGCCAAAPLHVSDVAEAQASRGAAATAGRRRVNAAGGWTTPLLLVAVLALACVVALGRTPAVCCCTCAAWLCRGPCAVRPRRTGATGAASPLLQRGAASDACGCELNIGHVRAGD
jgi:hypothetical protein